MRGGKIAFIGIFLALLLLPPLQMLFPFVDIQPLEEKRRLAPFPDIVDKYLHGDGRIATAINEWFDDHVGFRPFLIRLKHQIDYSVFDHSDRVLIGRDGWLFDPQYLNGVVDNERGGEPALRDIEARFLRLESYLADRGIKLVLLNNPTKETIYPQFLPMEAPHVPVNRAFQKLRRFLKDGRDWIYIDGQTELPKCGDHVFFHLMDIHMTPAGPFCYARLLVNAIAAAEHRDSPWKHRVTYVPFTSSQGGLADYLALLFGGPKEQFDMPTKIYDTQHPPPDGYFELNTMPDYQWIFHTREPWRAGKLPQTVVFGNSFSDHFLSAGMFRYFTDLYRAFGTGPELDKVLPEIPASTHYFIFQLFEGTLLEFPHEKILSHDEGNGGPIVNMGSVR